MDTNHNNSPQEEWTDIPTSPHDDEWTDVPPPQEKDTIKALVTDYINGFTKPIGGIPAIMEKAGQWSGKFDPQIARQKSEELLAQNRQDNPMLSRGAELVGEAVGPVGMVGQVVAGPLVNKAVDPIRSYFAKKAINSTGGILAAETAESKVPGVVSQIGTSISNKYLGRPATSAIKKSLAVARPEAVVTYLKNSGLGQKFVPRLENAIARGTYATTYYLLHSSNPEFQKVMEDSEGQ